MQDEEIKVSINLPYVEGVSQKLRRILKSHNLRPTFYTESILRKLLCQRKDRVATENKISFIKLTVVTAKQSTLMNLNGLYNCVQMNTNTNIPYLKNPDHINKISYMLPEIWLPNLR